MQVQVLLKQRRFYACAVIALNLASAASAANPLIPAGDVSLRGDIQLLADAGIIRGPVTSWPLAWGPILTDINRLDSNGQLTGAISSALARVRQRAAWETGVGEPQYRAGISAAENPTRIRSFADLPREAGEITAGISWIGNRLSIELNGQAISSPEDGEELRADGSHLAVNVGNYSIALSTLDRWWGPGWDGSLILSNNSRPIPAVMIDRTFTDPFKTKWLSWIGPWDASVVFGQMESDRVVPEPQFFGFRINFRPIPSLEIGLSRTAQWCGEGRPCDLNTFGDLLIGRDNRGGSGIDINNEPGNQLAGVDFRWAFNAFEVPLAIYGQFIGEDEAGGFPSKFLGQGGVEASGTWHDRWSWRGFGEFAITKCRFYQSAADYNCAYNHSIYETGYRYRGRSLGHGSDSDARIFSTGLSLADDAETQWQLLARLGELNRGGAPDARHTLTATPQNMASLELSHSRVFRAGVIDIGAGVERIVDSVSGEIDNDVRAFIQWRTSR